MRLTLEVLELNVHGHSGEQTDRKIDQILTILKRMEIIMTAQSEALAVLQTEVSETSTVVDSAIVLLNGLKAALDAAGTNPTALKALSDSLDSKTTALATAVAANTPAA